MRNAETNKLDSYDHIKKYIDNMSNIEKNLKGSFRDDIHNNDFSNKFKMKINPNNRVSREDFMKGINKNELPFGSDPDIKFNISKDFNNQKGEYKGKIYKCNTVDNRTQLDLKTLIAKNVNILSGIKHSYLDSKVISVQDNKVVNSVTDNQIGGYLGLEAKNEEGDGAGVKVHNSTLTDYSTIEAGMFSKDGLFGNVFTGGGNSGFSIGFEAKF